MKAPGPNCLKLKCDELLSSYGFKFILRRYIKALSRSGVGGGVEGQDAFSVSSPNLQVKAFVANGDTVGRRRLTRQATQTSSLNPVNLTNLRH